MPSPLPPDLAPAPSLAPPPPLRSPILFGPDGLRAGWSLLLFLLIAWLLGEGLLSLVHRLHPTPHRAAGSPLLPGVTLLSEALTFAVLALSTLVLARIERRPFRSFGLGRTPRALPQLLRGLLWGLFFLAALVGALAATHLLTFGGLLLSGPAALAQGALWALAFLFVALAEEFTTRGYLQFTLARGLAGILRSTTGSPHSTAVGFWASALVFSFVFGFGHHSNPGESPLGLVSAGLIGLVFCLSLWRTGSLWWAVGFHAAWDWAQSFLFGVADSGLLTQRHLLRSQPEGRPLLSGGLTGPEGSLYILAIVALLALTLVLSERGRGWPIPGSRLPQPPDSLPAQTPHPLPDL